MALHGLDLLEPSLILCDNTCVNTVKATCGRIGCLQSTPVKLVLQASLDEPLALPGDNLGVGHQTASSFGRSKSKSYPQ